MFFDQSQNESLKSGFNSWTEKVRCSSPSLQTSAGFLTRFSRGFLRTGSCPGWRPGSVPSGSRSWWIWVCRRRLCFGAGPITLSALTGRFWPVWFSGDDVKGRKPQSRSCSRACRRPASIRRCCSTSWCDEESDEGVFYFCTSDEVTRTLWASSRLQTENQRKPKELFASDCSFKQRLHQTSLKKRGL